MWSIVKHGILVNAWLTFGFYINFLLCRMKQAFAVQKKKKKKKENKKKIKAQRAQIMTRSAFFFLCMRQNPFVSLVVFGLGFSKSKQDAKHRGRVRAGPSVLWPTKGERNVFPHDTGIKIVDFLQQWHIISSLGLVFSSFFFFQIWLAWSHQCLSAIDCFWLGRHDDAKASQYEHARVSKHTERKKKKKQQQKNQNHKQ